MELRIAVAPGELIDKITILEIKAERIDDPEKLENVEYELSLLRETLKAEVPPSDQLDRLTSELKRVNEALWTIEDDIRDHERAQRFDSRFIELARSVYRTNDERAAIKRRINELLGSAIREEKSYSPY